jgi:hypothetical protein
VVSRFHKPAQNCAKPHTTMPQPFEQQLKESTKAYAGFSEYLSMGPQRSTQAVAKKLGKSKALIERWCAKYGWVDTAGLSGWMPTLRTCS